MTPDDPRDRLLDLLTTEATQSLSPAQARELADLLTAFPDEDPDSLALAAAAADLALAGPPVPLPPDLAAKLERSAAAFFRPPEPPRPAAPGYAWVGWVVAAGLAAVLVWSNLPKPDPTAAERLARLERQPGTRTFAAPPDAATGRVVWNEATQEGYLEVRGLQPNDPASAQYQLWIVDPSREHPVDGGVFDVRPDGTAVVPVRSALRVTGAKAFAVTREKSGGVVVSKGPMLVVLAPEKA